MPIRLRCVPDRNLVLDLIPWHSSPQIAWEPTNGRPGARQLYLKLADRLWQLTPGAMLFMFEGTGQNKFGLNWVRELAIKPSSALLSSSLHVLGF